MAPLPRFGRRRKIATAGALRRTGDAPAAVDTLAALLAGDPSDPAANVEMARALQILEDFAGAEEHYRRALAEQLDYALVVELAGVVGTQGRVDESNQLLDAALEIAATDPSADTGETHFMRAMIAAGGGRTEDARTALALIPDASSDRLKGFAARLAERLESAPAQPD